MKILNKVKVTIHKFEIVHCSEQCDQILLNPHESCLYPAYPCIYTISHSVTIWIHQEMLQVHPLNEKVKVLNKKEKKFQLVLQLVCC